MRYLATIAAIILMLTLAAAHQRALAEGMWDMIGRHERR